VKCIDYYKNKHFNIGLSVKYFHNKGFIKIIPFYSKQFYLLESAYASKKYKLHRQVEIIYYLNIMNNKKDLNMTN